MDAGSSGGERHLYGFFQSVRPDRGPGTEGHGCGEKTGERRGPSLEILLREDGLGSRRDPLNNYSKTRKTYEAYRKSGYSKKFFEEHRDELMLHKAAKQAFDQLDGKKVPSRQTLHEEFNRLLVEKKQAYAEYRQVKKEMQEYLIAKQTVETILNIDKKKEQEKEEKKPLR